MIMTERVPEDYKDLFDVIADVLHLYEFDRTDFKCSGLVARVRRGRKTGEIDFHIERKGIQYYQIDKFKEWAKPHIEEMEKCEREEKLKYENLRRKNKATLEMVDEREEQVILQMVKPKKKDDWFDVLHATIREFESEFGSTPSKQQLWSRLNSSPPRGYDLDYIERSGVTGFQLFEGKHLDREAFSKRYQRLYP